MNKKVFEMNFNVGKFIDTIYPFLNLTTSRADYFNNVIGVFLRNDMPNYGIDQASVSRLSSHQYDICRRAKRVILEPENLPLDEFLSKLLCDAAASEKVIAYHILEEIKKCTIENSIGFERAFSAYKHGHYGQFLLIAFKCAVSAPNMPQKTKAKTGKKKRGSIQSMFYLSEEEKNDEIHKLNTKLLKTETRLNEEDFNAMVELIAYAGLQYSYEEKKRIAVRFLKNWKRTESQNAPNDFLWRLECASKSYKRKDGFLNWEEAVNEAKVHYKLAPLPAAYRKAVRQNTFAETARIIDQISGDEIVVSSKDTKNLLLTNNFFLPNFDGHITESLWSHCVAIARLAGMTGCAEEFISVLSNTEEHSPKTMTMADRIDALKSIAIGSQKPKQAKNK